MENSKKCIGQNMSIINRYFKVYLKAKLVDVDISPTEFMVLLVLFNSKGISQEGVIDKLGYDKGMLARTIKSLLDRKYINREHDEYDKRAYKLYVTDKSLKLKDFIINILKSWNDNVTSGLDEELVNVVIEQLKIMAENAVKSALNAKNGVEYEK